MPPSRSAPPSDPGPRNTCRFTTNRSMKKPQAIIKQLGDDAVSGVVNFDSNPVEINRKVATNKQYARLGLVPGIRDVDLECVPVPAEEPGRAEEDGVQRYTSSGLGGRLVARHDVKTTTRPPAYLAPHLRATTDVHASAPPSVPPNSYYRPPYSHGHFQQRPYPLPTQSQTAISSNSTLVEVKQASAPPARYYDARRHYRDARFQPYPRPSPHFLDENEQDPDTRVLPPGGSARYQQAGGDALQAHAFERHDVGLRGYEGRPFALPQLDRGAAFEVGTVYPSHASTFTGEAIHARSLKPIVEDPTRLTPPYGTSHCPEQRARTRARVEDDVFHSPSHLVGAYYQQVHNDSMRAPATSHCVRPAPNPGVDETVDSGLGHTPTKPAKSTPAPIQLSVVQQQACPAPPADRSSSPKQFRWILAQPDEMHTTAYYRLSCGSEYETSSQLEQVRVHGASVLPSKQAALGYSGANPYPQDARAHAYNPCFKGNDSYQHQASDVPTGYQHEHPFATANSPLQGRQEAYDELSPNTNPTQRPPPPRESPLSIARCGGPFVHPAPYLAQTSQYQQTALHPQSMFAHGGAVMAYPSPLKVASGQSTSPLYERGYASPEGAVGYAIPQRRPSANGASSYACTQGTFAQRPNIARLQAVGLGNDTLHIDPLSEH